MRTRSVIWRILAAVTLFGGSSAIWAHPGHSHFSEGIGHALSSGFHVGVMAAVGLLLSIGATFVRHQLAARRLRLAGVTLLLGAGLMLMAGV